MSDIYGRQPHPFGGAIAADSAVLYFSQPTNTPGVVTDLFAGAAVGLLVQSFQSNYNQPINRIYDATSNLVYYIAGRCRGEGGLQSIVGPRSLAVEFLLKFGNVCLAGSNNFYLAYAPRCDVESADGLSLIDTNQWGTEILSFSGVVVNNTGHAFRAEDMLVNSQNAFMFASMGMARITQQG